eukprot:Skav236139  [mRNA]  locus=scaffold88:89556:90212:- [translate_table: standard]
MQDIDPNLISSAALTRPGRTGAARLRDLPPEQIYFVLPGDTCIVVVVSNEQRLPLRVPTARYGARMLREADPVQALRQSGVLNQNHELQAASLRAAFQACLLSPPQCNFMFSVLCFCGSMCLARQDIVYVVDDARSARCSCHIFSLHPRCEHSLFADSLRLPHRQPRLDLSNLPASRGPGRERSAGPTPRQQPSNLKQAASNKKARRSAMTSYPSDTS